MLVPRVANAAIAWTLYNDQDQVVSSGTTPVPPTAAGDYRWNLVTATIPVDLPAPGTGTDRSRTGSLVVQLVNEGSQPVYFDDLTITHPKEAVLVSQENHYYPFGLALSGVAVNTVPAAQPSQELYNGGSELQDELLGEAGIYSTYFRAYDPTTGRFQGVDPLADKYSDESVYGFAFNDPANFNDPSGAEPPQEGERMIFVHGRYMNPFVFDSNGAHRQWQGSTLDWLSYQLGGPEVTVDGRPRVMPHEWVSTTRAGHGAVGNGAFGPWTNQTLWNYVPSAHGFDDVNNLRPEIECGFCVNKKTLHGNILGLTYAGSENPRDNNSDETFGFIPISAADYPPIGHDRRYDILKTRGGIGLLTDSRAIGADYRFVVESYEVVFQSLFRLDFKTSFQAALLAEGLGLAALPKTIWTMLSETYPIHYIGLWYHVSNHDINNIPVNNIPTYHRV
ncbi:RHS repeat-associated core domain-containing protein [Hymenobacter elongatus]|uniref:RHS repeat-associated core domain-containing protein n=1 Tax=Hymenobacter elongatus TaxID=877208 RepID=UPI0014367A22|nr:RHS repeat-associated core domain-containing protein [Hymenobacter elongatus]